ncbi:MAG TPA: hypothetical protein VGN63_19065 [Flavisolibacter sp.]|jgi:arginine decarboxylase-like protein|nr:hypothetical protein [Flavisolibacter sp.]
MAQVKMEDIIDHLSFEMKRALNETLEEHFPNQRFDINEVFRTFKRKVYNKTSIWESVPDSFVKTNH